MKFKQQNSYFFTAIGFILIGFILLSFQAFASKEEDDWDESKKIIESGFSSGFSPGINYSDFCSQCLDQSTLFSKGVIISPINNKKVSLSKIDEKSLQKVFKIIANNEDIPFAYIVDGCYARSHAIARLLDQEQIISGKIFIEGDLYFQSKKFDTEIGWSYHVANIVLLSKNGKEIPMVIDPAIKSAPMTIEEWKGFFLKNKKTKIKEMYFQNRFAYDSDDKNADLVDYNAETLKNAKYKNQEHSKILYMYEKTFK